jgi:hypothetical protein
MKLKTKTSRSSTSIEFDHILYNSSVRFYHSACVPSQCVRAGARTSTVAAHFARQRGHQDQPPPHTHTTHDHARSRRTSF